jgi:hypothetical protein
MKADRNSEATKPKSKAEGHKEVIMSSVQEQTESPVIADAARAATHIYYAKQLVRPEELSTLVGQALDGAGEPFRLTFDDDSTLYLTTSDGILTATVSK